MDLPHFPSKIYLVIRHRSFFMGKRGLLGFGGMRKKNGFLKQHLKSSKSEKVKAIVRHSFLRQNSLRRAGQPTLRNARILIQNDNRASADSSETDESDAIDSGGRR